METSPPPQCKCPAMAEPPAPVTSRAVAFVVAAEVVVPPAPAASSARTGAAAFWCRLLLLHLRLLLHLFLWRNFLLWWDILLGRRSTQFLLPPHDFRPPAGDTRDYFSDLAASLDAADLAVVGVAGVAGVAAELFPREIFDEYHTAPQEQ